jgi:hypothetical protein
MFDTLRQLLVNVRSVCFVEILESKPSSKPESSTCNVRFRVVNSLNFERTADRLKGYNLDFQKALQIVDFLNVRSRIL